MKLTAKSRYAIRGLIDLALYQKDGYVSLRDIAARQKISFKYLESCFADLKRAGIVTGLTGKSGGYRLACDPEEITLHTLLDLFEGIGPLCAPSPAPSPMERFIEVRVFEQLQAGLSAFGDAHSLADLVRAARQ